MERWAGRRSSQRAQWYRGQAGRWLAWHLVGRSAPQGDRSIAGHHGECRPKATHRGTRMYKGTSVTVAYG